MVTHEPGNNIATCYFWIYKSNVPNFPADCPGPQIYTTVGDTINISITNATHMDENHAFFIPGMYNSGPIAPGATVNRHVSGHQSGQLSLLRQPECPGEPGHGAARRLHRHARQPARHPRPGGPSVDPLRPSRRPMSSNCSTTSAGRPGGRAWPGNREIPPPIRPPRLSGSTSGSTTRPAPCSLRKWGTHPPALGPASRRTSWMALSGQTRTLCPATYPR